MHSQHWTLFVKAVAVSCIVAGGVMLGMIRVAPRPDVGGELLLAAAQSGNYIEPLESPLNSPLAIPSSPQSDLSFTPTYTIFLPIVRYTVAPNKFGTEVDSDFSDGNGAQRIEEAGFSWYRHMQVDWVSHEPLPGQYITTPSSWDDYLDIGVGRASAAGIRPILVIRNSPAWATVSGITGCDSIKPTTYITFANFVSWVVSRYEQPPYNVKYYELWNEPDLSVDRATTEIGCWRSGVEYADMLHVVYSIVKAQHPDIYILNGGVAELGQWAQDFIVTGTNYIDI